MKAVIPFIIVAANHLRILARQMEPQLMCDFMTFLQT